MYLEDSLERENKWRVRFSHSGSDLLACDAIQYQRVTALRIKQNPNGNMSHHNVRHLCAVRHVNVSEQEMLSSLIPSVTLTESMFEKPGNMILAMLQCLW